MFLSDLDKAKRPAILVGGGAYAARHLIEEVATEYRIPCFRTWNAQDIITDDMPVYCGTVGTYGGPGRNFGIQNCDLLLSLGCRMSGRITGGMPETFAREAKKYIVDVDPAALDPALQQVKGDSNLLCEAESFMRGIPMDPSACHMRFDDWMARCRDWVQRYDPVKPEHLPDPMFMRAPIHHYGFMRKLSDAIPANAIVVSDTGGNVIMMGHCFRSKKGQRIFTSNGNTPMGFAMCGAIGAWFADPTRPVYCIIGDGGFNMNIQELQTLVSYGVDVKIFLINNRILGNTKSYQRVNGMKEIACGPDGYQTPNYEDVVKAYGVDHLEVSIWRDMDIAFKIARKNPGPMVFDVMHDDFCDYAPRISAWDVGIEDAFPFLPRDEFRANMIGVEPLPGWENKK